MGEEMGGTFRNPLAALILLAALAGAAADAQAARPAAAQNEEAAAGGTDEDAPTSDGEETPSGLPPEVEAILSAPAAEDYPGEEQCVSKHRIREIKVLDDRHVLFKLDRKRLYLVQFKNRCPGLRRNDPVIYEPTNRMSVCRHDILRGLMPFGFGSNRAGPPCFIPGFQQISEEQLAALTEALRQRR